VVSAAGDRRADARDRGLTKGLTQRAALDGKESGKGKRAKALKYNGHELPGRTPGKVPASVAGDSLGGLLNEPKVTVPVVREGTGPGAGAPSSPP
jgi:hypothetical protein